MNYRVTLYTQAQITLAIRNPTNTEDAAQRAITLASTGVPTSFITGMTNFGEPVRIEVESGDWDVLEITDEDGNYVGD